MTTLYNCHHDGDQYRITKFVDGNPESSYLCTFAECECPAGSRPTCRHRLMLPAFINMNTVNTHWFMNFDGDRRFVDLMGNVLPNDMPADAPAEQDTHAEVAKWRRI